MNKRKALGKGIEALIPRIEDIEEGNVVICPIDIIKVNPNQPRKSFNEKKLEELVQTINEKGIISPLIVQKEGEGYQLISGERRLRAAKKAGFHEIPVLVRKANEIESLELSLIENIQREDLNPIDEAKAFKSLLKQAGYTQEILAKKIGRDRSSISNTLRLLKLPSEIKESISKGMISAGHGRALISLERPEDQLSAFRKIEKDGLSVRATEKLVSRILMGVKKKKIIEDIHLEAIQNKLRGYLGTQVKIKKKGKGGNIIIEFYSENELERILDLIFSNK